MRRVMYSLTLIVGLFSSVSSPFAHTIPAKQTATAIEGLLQQQVKDWNAGNLDAFASGYKNSPDILFMGATIRHGYADMLAGYKARYATRAAMGTLTFSNLDVHPLDAKIATTTGNFHLSRSATGGGNVDGYFLLVLEKTPAGWKIVCDDTTVPAVTPVK